LTEDQDPMIWLHERAVESFTDLVAKARFAGLHEQYIEEQKGKVSIHAICALAGLNPSLQDIRDCVKAKWPVAQINRDLRAMKEAQQAAAKPSTASSGPIVYRDHLSPPRLVFGSRGSLGGMR
jgi:hypothetical protein